MVLSQGSEEEPPAEQVSVKETAVSVNFHDSVVHLGTLHEGVSGSKEKLKLRVRKDLQEEPERPATPPPIRASRRAASPSPPPRRAAAQDSEVPALDHTAYDKDSYSSVSECYFKFLSAQSARNNTRASNPVHKNSSTDITLFDSFHENTLTLS